MKFMPPTVLALTQAPSMIQAWSLGPSYFSVPMVLRETNTPMEASSGLQRQRSLANRMLEQTERMFEDMDRMFEPRSRQQLAQQRNSDGLSLQRQWLASPRYELVDNKDTFQLSMDVPGVLMDNMEVVVENEGYLTVRGHREVTSPDGNSKYASKFSQSFSLDAAVDVDRLTANLDNGVLTVTAPKDPAKLEEKVRKIAITAAPAIAAEHQETPVAISEEKPAEQVAEAPDTIDLDKEPVTDKVPEGEQKMEDLTA